MENGNLRRGDNPDIYHCSGMGKGNIYSGNYSQEILWCLAIVIWLEEEDLCTVLVFCPNEFTFRREDRIATPPFRVPEIRFCICQILKEVSFAFSYKRKSFSLPAKILYKIRKMPALQIGGGNA